MTRPAFRSAALALAISLGPASASDAAEAGDESTPIMDGIVIGDGLGILPDGIHFDHHGQVALGRGHAQQMLALEGHDR